MASVGSYAGSKNKHLVPKDYRDVAQAMEKQFIRHMIDQMDKTVGRAEEESSSQEYYKSLLHDEFANKISQSDSLGVQDIILDEIYPRRLRNDLTYKNFMKTQRKGHNHRDTEITEKKL